MSVREEVLVVGGAGYIGTHTVVALSTSGYSPIILDNFSNSDPQIYEGLCHILSTEVPLYRGDACDEGTVEKIFRNHKLLRYVIHFAALKSVSHSLLDPLSYYRNNLSSLWTVLKMRPTYVVFSSSCTVYGLPKRLPVNELSPFEVSSSPYGRTKQVCEQMLEDVCKSESEVSAVSLRYFNPVGAHSSASIGELPLGEPSNLVPALTRAVQRSKPLRIYGTDYDTPDGSCVRDFLHVMDLAEAHVSALRWLKKQDTPCYEAFNCGTGRGHSVLEVISTFEEISGIKVKRQLSERREGDLPVIYAEVKKAADLLKWHCKRSLSSSLEDAWRWQKTLSR